MDCFKLMTIIIIIILRSSDINVTLPRTEACVSNYRVNSQITTKGIFVEWRLVSPHSLAAKIVLMKLLVLKDLIVIKFI